MTNYVEWKDRIISAAQSHWLISLEQNKKIKATIRRFEFTASSIIRMDDKSMTLRVKKMFFFPIRMEVKFENVVGLSPYLVRGKPLKKQEILAMITDPELRKKDRKKAALLKWSAFSAIIIALFGIAAIAVIFIK